MLQPKKTKFRKAHKGLIHGVAKGGTELAFGQTPSRQRNPSALLLARSKRPAVRSPAR